MHPLYYVATNDDPKTEFIQPWKVACATDREFCLLCKTLDNALQRAEQLNEYAADAQVLAAWEAQGECTTC